MQRYNYVTIDTIFSKFSRDLRGTDIHESDIIEWVGEALGFLQTSSVLEEAVSFLEIKNHTADLPFGFKNLIQAASYKGNIKDFFNKECVKIQEEQECEEYEEQEICEDCIEMDCQGEIILDDENIVYFRPGTQLSHMSVYNTWIYSRPYKSGFTPMRLSNHSFFNSIVCIETSSKMASLYQSCKNEYTLVGGFPNLQIRTSFKEGIVALSYLRTMLDPDTGYPLIPDDMSHISAITYYIKWKMAERLRWEGRQGFNLEAQDAEAKWLRYVKQANSKSKMPYGQDQYQNTMEQSMYLIPRMNKYQNYFGNLGRSETIKFRDL